MVDKNLMLTRARRAGDLLALRGEAARIERSTQDTVVMLPLADITVDGRVQVRVAGLDADTVAAYATVFAEGGEFPPVVVFRDERDGTLYLADGFHRVAAARKAGLTEIAAEVRPGGLVGAVEYAEEANLTHGLNLTIRDKRAIFERRLTRGHEWATWSNRAVAAALGVDEGTIRNWRKALEVTTAENSAVAPAKRVGADGREYDVRKIQAAARRRATSKLAPRYVDDPDVVQDASWYDGPQEVSAWEVAERAEAAPDAATLLELAMEQMFALINALGPLLDMYEIDGDDHTRLLLDRLWDMFPRARRVMEQAEKRVQLFIRQTGGLLHE
jgi:uncharacterized ParB-like nuclease family protein/transposase